MHFQAPARVDTSVYLRLPDAYRTVSLDNEWVQSQPGVACAPVLEGPSFDLQGRLYFVDVPGGRIFRAEKSGQVELVIEYDGWPNGLKIAADGRIFVADFKHGLMLLDPVAKMITPYLTRAGGEPFKGLNDLFIARNGDIYFTDQGMTGLHDATGRVFRLSPQGQLSCLLNNVPSPNGIVMNVQETVLFVAVTRANAIWRMPLRADGSVAKVGNFIQLSGGGGPDGLAIDEQGRLAIAHVGMGTVWIFDAHGRPELAVTSSEGLLTTNVAFGGDDRKTLFITEAGSLSVLQAHLDVPGKRMASHQSEERIQ